MNIKFSIRLVALAVAAVTTTGCTDIIESALARSDPGSETNEATTTIVVVSDGRANANLPTTVATAPVPPVNPAVVGANIPASTIATCLTNESDPDGDGYGFENGRSCLVPPEAAPQTLSVTISTDDANTDVDSPLPRSQDYCLSAESDPDGDGYGYENFATCLIAPAAETSSEITTPQARQQSDNDVESQSVTTTLPECQSADSDPDGDGYGYENYSTCLAIDNAQAETETVIDYSSNVIDTDGFPENLHRVTDVILTAGQSNAFAEGTRFQPDIYPQDRLDDRILVWTQDNGWKVADPLTQIWEHDHFPARLWDPSRSSNSPGYQIARAIVDADPNRVVAFIPTSTPGQSIHYWRYGAEAYNTIKQRVENALNDIPHKYQLDLIWWMQGESDANASDYYRNALGELVDNWRGEPWYGADKYFIANETIRFEVNQIFRELRTNTDPFTDYSAAEGLPSIQPNGAHFNSASYRVIGNRVQQVYFNMLQATGAR